MVDADATVLCATRPTSVAALENSNVAVAWLLSDALVGPAVIDTDGEGMPMVHPLPLGAGTHLLTARTMDRKPVRIHGWVTENSRGLTWEMMGINGAQASIGLKWLDAGLAPVYLHRQPALIVLAYGTNEARNRDWTYEGYRDMFVSLLDKYRRHGRDWDGTDHPVTVPDFAGNSYFNTLGNLLREPRAALLFVDFRDGTVLQLQG